MIQITPMKKAIFSVFLLLLLGASFFAGYMFHAGNLPRNTAESLPLKTVGDLGRPGAAGDDSESAAPGSVGCRFYKRQLLGVGSKRWNVIRKSRS